MEKLVAHLNSKPELANVLNRFLQDDPRIELVNLCTDDGFNISMLEQGGISVDAERMSAIASALRSLSDSAANQVLNGLSLMSTVETDNGCLILLKIIYRQCNCVLAIAASHEITLGETRYKAKRLAQSIVDIV